MKVINLKLRGLGKAPETGWIAISQDLTCVNFTSPAGRKAFCDAIQTINPPYDCREEKPFSEYPQTIIQNGHTRLVRPAKRTIAFAIFSSTPKLVHELANISDLLFETDRIEVGRRLDYSRWINFVELASSTRWSELSDRILHLSQSAFPLHHAALPKELKNLKATDRLTGQVLDILKSWLKSLKGKNPKTYGKEIDDILQIALRSDDFHKAKAITRKRLPMFIKISLTPGKNIITADNNAHLDTIIKTTEYDGLAEELQHLSFHSLSAKFKNRFSTLRHNDFMNGYKILTEGLNTVQQVEVISCLVMAAAKYRTGTAPLLLFDIPKSLETSVSTKDLLQFFKSVSQNSQCICCTDSNEPLSVDFNLLQYCEHEIIINQGAPPSGDAPRMLPA